MPRKVIYLALCLAGVSATICGGSEIKQISLPLPPDITRADIYYVEPDYKPEACVVLCPGINENGVRYLSRKDFQAFAIRYHVALVAISFASDDDALAHNQGYYYTAKGSGSILLKGIDEHIGKDLPILLYGFSGGAHFVSSFQENFPQRVKAWCAYSAAWWDESIDNKIRPPGIVACGKLDDRYDASFEYFQEGRKLRKPWCWLSLADTNHAENEKLFRFVEAYFASILESKSDDGIWCDIATKEKASGDSETKPDSVAWLPDEHMGSLWNALHKP